MCRCPVTDFLGGTEERAAGFKREVATVQEVELGL